jgi:hypothetical protein
MARFRRVALSRILAALPRSSERVPAARCDALRMKPFVARYRRLPVDVYAEIVVPRMARILIMDSCSMR